MATVLRLLEDNRCEVRQKAGEVLSGFIHYDIIKDTSALIVSAFILIETKNF